MKNLKLVTTSNIGRYITFLKKGEFIISDKTYQPKVKSYHYQINEKFLGNITEIKLDVKSKLSTKIIKNQRLKRSHYNRLEPHLKIMSKEFLKMKFDYSKAKEWIENNPTDEQKKLSYLTSIDQIEDERFRYFKRNKTNKRLDTNITNLKSDLRQFIKGDLVNIDVKNSQPLILGIGIDAIINERDTLCPLLHHPFTLKTFGVKRIKHILNFRQNEEKSKMANLKMYFNSVKKGTLYDDFIDKYTGNIERDDVKDIMFKVLFSKNIDYNKRSKFIPYNKEKKVFNSVYPFVYEIVKIFKNKDNKKLPIYLQKIESYLFIDCITKELVENGIIPFTIHDSVMVKKQDKEKTIEIINKVFIEQVGIVPKLKIEKV